MDRKGLSHGQMGMKTCTNIFYIIKGAIGSWKIIYWHASNQDIMKLLLFIVYHDQVMICKHIFGNIQDDRMSNST